MARANEVFIMDVFGNLTRKLKRPRRKRCVICNELTHSTISKTYYLPKSEKYFGGTHCEECSKKQDEIWKKEWAEWQSHME